MKVQFNPRFVCFLSDAVIFFQLTLNGSLSLSLQDDEFEEFPADEWSADEEDAEDVNVWEDNWDEDTVEDDFSKQLRAELDKASKSQDVEMKS